MAGYRFPLEQDEKYKARVLFVAKNATGIKTCSLYFPEAVNFSDGLVYDNANLGVAGEIARRAIKNAGNIDGNTINNIVNTATSATKNMFGTMDTMGQKARDILPEAISLGVQGFTPDEISSAVSVSTGITANPHKRSIFRDVALRTFSFSFLMSPQSKKESDQIEKIVQFFRENAYPEKLAEIGGFGYKFPTKFLIHFLYDTGEISQAPKILESYLTSVNTVLNPRSSSFFEDGKVNEVQLTMSFQEERALDKKDIEDGY